MPIHTILTSKVGQIEQVFGMRSCLYKQDYKSLCAAVTMCCIVVI